jgi:hypothetical protein
MWLFCSFFRFSNTSPHPLTLCSQDTTGKQKIKQDPGKMMKANIIWTDELIDECIPLVEARGNIWNLSVIFVLLDLLYNNQFLIHIPPFLFNFSFMCMFCRSLFVILYFFFWSLCCLFFFDMRILITPLVSSNSCYNCIQGSVVVMIVW